MNYKLLYITLLSVLLLSACSKENGIEPGLGDRTVELSFHVDDFIRNGSAFRATDAGTATEQEVSNLYLFLFDNTGVNPVVKYYINASTFTGGTYSSSEKKITLNMTQAEAGARQVYIVANIDPALKTDLDGVTTVAGLQAVFRNTSQPWSTNITTPILMSGNATHNFITQGYQLNSVHLIRAVAKLELNVTLTSGFQAVPVISGGNLTEYKYRYVGFDTRTYVEKPAPRPDNPANSSPDAWPNTANWMTWGGTSYTLGSGGKVTGLKLITYLNERDQSGTTVEIELPRADSGPLPPPEFGPELYKLPLPTIIERNTWYKYDIEI